MVPEEVVPKADVLGEDVGDCIPGADCDDSDPCTFGDHCDAGSICVGTMYACDDPYGCTVDTCLGDGTCSNAVAPDACLIGAECYVDEQLRPGMPCWICRPLVAQDDWTQNDGAPCDDLDACTAGETCLNGVCAGGADICSGVCVDNADCLQYEDGDLCNGLLFCDDDLSPPACVPAPDSVVTCPADQDTECSQSLCQPETGLCAPVNLADGGDCNDGDSCTSGDQCVDGLCQGTPIPGCGVGGAVLSEDFEGGFPPVGWSTTGTGWQLSGNAHGGAHSAEHVMSQADDRLFTPSLDLSGATSVTLSFWHDTWEAMQTTSYTIEVSTDGGDSWSAPLYSGPQNTGGWQPVEVDLSPYGGYTIQVGWHYIANDLFTPPGKWFVDDVLVSKE